MLKLKRFLLVILMILTSLAVYIEIVNRHSKNMTYRQKVLKAFYPALMWLSGKKARTIDNTREKKPFASFYDLKAIANDGKEFDFTSLKGKKVLVVNTASDCGYTNQYDDLQHLYEQHKNTLAIIGFPANDFKEQEKGSDEEIAQFCRINYGVTFPLMKKSTVIQSPQQHPVYLWLTHANLNGWCSRIPSWNFSKYLVNEEGVLTHYFDPSVSPLSQEVINAINE